MPSRGHDDVELFEAGGHAGGHSNTVTHDSLDLDTGFIVHNEANYPLLTRLFRELGVATQPSEMSFSMSCGCGLEWSSRRPWRAGAGLLREILRFLRTAGDAETEGKSFDRFLRDEGYSDSFRWHYLVPMTSALWSTAPGDALEFPAAYGIEFFRNHGMLGLRRERWRTVTGGSRAYVQRACSSGSLLRFTSRPRCARCAGPTPAWSCACDDGSVRSFDGRRRRDERAPGARPARGPLAGGARAALGLRDDQPTRPSSTPTRASCRGGARTAPRGTTSRRAAASTRPRRPSPTP